MAIKSSAASEQSDVRSAGPAEAPPAEWALSTTVSRILRKYPGSVCAHDIARELLATSAYGGRIEGQISVGAAPWGARRQPARDWLRDTQPLFRLLPGQKFYGRQLLMGLALGERTLFRELSEGDFLTDLEKELEDRGRVLSREGEKLRAERRHPGEIVPVHDDAPADVDQLGRAILAEVIATRIRRVRRRGPFWVSQSRAKLATVAANLSGHKPSWAAATGWIGGSRSYIVHVDGAWGTGKTSLLRFLTGDLHGDADTPADERWVVVPFNAWAHQRIVPPWWWLMTALHREGTRSLWGINKRRACSLWLLGIWWRVRDGWAAYLIFPVAVGAAIVLWRQGFFGSTLTTASGSAQALAAIVAFAATVWGALQAMNRWLGGGGDASAAGVLRRTGDPMRLVTRRFTTLVHWIRQPVVIIMDDLDRCQAAYIVELLEGIQTLFVDAPVVYVVAADGSWLRDCYAQIYKDFCHQVGEPGRPLGALFLEKTFQETIVVPRIASSTRDTYWKGLLSNKALRPADPRGADDRDRAEAMFERLGTPAQIIERLTAEEGNSTLNLQELRRAAVLQLESQAVQEHTRHTLDEFAGLLEDNPRAMKKLVNSYGIKRDLQVLEGRTLAGDDATLRELALWTIVCLRWPVLADYLDRHPDAVEAALGRTSPTMPDDPPTPELERLFRSDSVHEVVAGNGVDVSLNPEAIYRFTGRTIQPVAAKSGRSRPQKRKKARQRAAEPRTA